MLRALPSFATTFDLRSALSRLGSTIYAWQCRQDERQHLGSLDERLLKDIGLTRLQALAEIRKPFWRP